MTEHQDQDAQSSQGAQQEKNTCAAEILSLPQDEGEPCTYCADEHPELAEQATRKPKQKKRDKTKQPTEAPPKKKNWFGRLSFPMQLVTILCGLLATLGLGKCCADMPKPPSGANCSHQVSLPADGAITVAQADANGRFTGRTTYQYQQINGVKQLISAKHFSSDGKLTASLTFTRDNSGSSCLVQFATYDSEGKVTQLYSDTKLPDSEMLNQLDLWTYLGQLN